MISAIHCLTMQSHVSYSSCFCLLDRTIKIVYFVLEQLKFGSLNTILTTGCLTWQLIANNSADLRIIIVALHKDDRGYKKFSNSLKLSYSTVVRVIQRLSKTVTLGTGLARVDQRR